MKNFKKLLCLLFSVLFLFAFGCLQTDNSAHSPAITLNFVAPDGAPALSIAKFISDNEKFGTDVAFDYSIVSSSEIGSHMQQGKADLMIIPVNAASKLYKANASDPYKRVAVITHGNLYIVSSDGTQTLNDLKGKVIGVIGQGLVPDLTLRAVLSDNGLLGDVVVGDTPTDGKITVRYFAQAPDMIPLLKKGQLSVGLLPEPACTTLTKSDSAHTWNRLDLQELYDAELKAYPQAVLMAKTSVYNKYKTQIDGMKSYFDANVSWVKENTELAVNAVNGALPAGVTPSLTAQNISATVVDNCKIYFEASAQAKNSVQLYLNKIITINPQAAKAVSDDFFA